MADDLFTPTIPDNPITGTPPWRPNSIVYPAFFGGALAGTLLGLLNAKRLRLGPPVWLMIAAAGVVALTGRAVLTATLDGEVGPRVLGSLAGVVVWGVVAATQKRAFRAFEATDREPASLVGPGLGAVFGCGLLEVCALTAVLG